MITVPRHTWSFTLALFALSLVLIIAGASALADAPTTSPAAPPAPVASSNHGLFSQFAPADLPRAGVAEIGLSGFINLSPGNSSDLALLYGPFLSRQFQIAGTVQVDHSGALNSQQYGVEPNIYFPGATPAEPFVGLFLGGAHTSGPSFGQTDVDYGAQGGVKFFVSPNLAFTTAVQYRKPQHANAGVATTQFMIGLSTYVGPGRVTTLRQPSRHVIARNPVAGKVQVGVSGFYNISPSGDYNIDLLYGPFVSPTFQVALDAGTSRQGTFRDTTYGVEPNWFFPQGGPIVPYVGAFVGGDSFSRTGGHETSLAIGGQGGVQYFLNPNTAATASIVVRKPVHNSLGPLTTLTQIDLGLSLYLPR